MKALAPGLSYVDLQFLGQPKAIATAVIEGAGEVALVDPGPTTCLDALERALDAQGVRLADVTPVVLTHIHLDHAGAAGTLARRHPRVRVLVHARGAPHLKDPTRLLDSAQRLYGAEAMARLWGEFLPVPAARVTALDGGERIELAGRLFEVAYTPGHASHHVSYFESSSGIAFVGDVAGICIDGGYILPPTPPPDVDLEAWDASVRRVEAWRPKTLFLTHFGPSPFEPVVHLQTLLGNLQIASRIARAMLEEAATEEERRLRFGERIRREARKHMPEAQMASYGMAAPFEYLWLGLARYWRSRQASA